MKEGEGERKFSQKPKQLKFLKSLAPPLMAALVALSPIHNPPGTQNPSSQ